MESLSVVCWLWHETTSQRTYLPHFVNVLQSMVARHLSRPHRFICVTDDTDGFSPAVEVMRLPDSAQWLGSLKTAENRPHLPTSYRRLWAFSPEATVLGDRILNLDIDCLILDSLDPLLDGYDDDFMGWAPNTAWGNEGRIGGGTWLLRIGTRPKVWSSFSMDAAREARSLGYRGSDQAWLSYQLQGCRRWPKSIGIVQRQDMPGAMFGRHPPPKGTRICHFNGPQKPWQCDAAWVKDAWK